MDNEQLNREFARQQAVTDIVSFAHKKVWDGDFTAAESRLIWLSVIGAMIESIKFDRQHDVLREDLKLPAYTAWHQIVSVYPHGKPEQAARGRTLYAEESFVLIRIDTVPAFVVSRMPPTPPTAPLFMTLTRALDPETRKKGVGPWVEIGGGGHYEVECIAGEVNQ